MRPASALISLFAIVLLASPSVAKEHAPQSALVTAAALANELSAAIAVVGQQAVECQPIVLASGEGSERGGGDLRTADADAAWFLGPAPIRYCFEASKDFGVPPEVLAKSVEEAFSAWRSYISERRVNENKSTSETITMKSEQLPRCDGSEDLKFYFGVQTPETQRIRGRYTNPSAFAHKTAYDMNSGRGKGFIWIAPPSSVDASRKVPDWTRPNHLKAQLVHELGHIAGCEHIDGTIMREDFVKLLFPDSPIGQLTRIDGTKALAPGRTIQGTIGFFGRSEEDATTFKRFVGRRPSGHVRAQVTFSDDNAVKLTVQDSLGLKNIPISAIVSKGTGRAVASGAHSPLAVFKTAFEGRTKTSGLNSVLILAEVKDARGTPLSATIQLNMTGGSGPLYINFIEDGQMVDLFNTFDFDPEWLAK